MRAHSKAGLTSVALLLTACGVCLGQYFPPSGGGSGTIPKTTAVLKGDNAGNATVASAGTDYVTPSGKAATTTALAATPNQCRANNFATGIAASGNANYSQPSFNNLSGAATAGHLPANVRVRGSEPASMAEAPRSHLARRTTLPSRMLAPSRRGTLR